MIHFNKRLLHHKNWRFFCKMSFLITITKTHDYSLKKKKIHPLAKVKKWEKREMIACIPGVEQRMLSGLTEAS